MRRTKLLKESGPYRVESCADGTMTITPRLQVEHGDCPSCLPGLTARMSLANDIERLLNGGKTWEEAKK